MLDLVHALAQRLGRVPGPDGHGLLEDHRPGVDSLVDEVDGDAVSETPAASASSIGVVPGKAGRSDGWTLIAVCRSRKPGVSRCM